MEKRGKYYAFAWYAPSSVLLIAPALVAVSVLLRKMIDNCRKRKKIAFNYCTEHIALALVIDSHRETRICSAYRFALILYYD